MEFPVTKTLSLNASVRADTYKDLGEDTINPKVALRPQRRVRSTLTITPFWS